MYMYTDSTCTQIVHVLVKACVVGYVVHRSLFTHTNNFFRKKPNVSAAIQQLSSVV